MTGLRFSLLGLAALGLSACGDPFPEDFTIAVDGDTALGFAKLSEFSDDEILGALNTLCPAGPVTKYTTDNGADGTKFFGAVCATGFSGGPGTIYVTRTPDGTFAYDLP